MRSYPRNCQKQRMSLAVLLLMVLWVFPRPVVHSHEDIARTNSGVSALQEHLMEFHSQVPLPDNNIHVHWVLNNGSVHFATCNASSPTIITSLFPHEFTDGALWSLTLDHLEFDVLATRRLAPVLSLYTFSLRHASCRLIAPKTTLQPSLLSLACLLAC